MTPEGEVKAKVKAIFKRYHIWYFMPVSSGYGKHGVPDFICCVNGRFLGIECKAAKGRLTDLQSQQHIEITAAGGTVLVIYPDQVRLVESWLQSHGAALRS